MYLEALILVLIIVLVYLYSLNKDLRCEIDHVKTNYDLVKKETPVVVVAETASTGAVGAVGAVGAAGAVGTGAASAGTGAASALPADESEVPAVPADDAVEGFCPKLLQRSGFCDAGARTEKMNPYRGTFYNMRQTSILPQVVSSWKEGYNPGRGTRLARYTKSGLTDL